MLESLDLALVWGILIAFAVLAYVVLDGFDLGIGILMPLVRDPGEREIMVNSVAPVWDGNETWLILGGGGLFAAFPLAYAIVLPAFYPLLIAMLLGLIFRGVAFEFRFRSVKNRHWWDRGFILGSFVATLCQGIMLGAFIQGITVEDRSYAGGWYDWLTPFSLFVGFAVVAGYTLLGATWLVMKTEGSLQDRLWKMLVPLVVALLFCIGVISLWTPIADEDVRAVWFSWPNLLFFSPVPFLVVASAALFLRSVRQRHDYLPFLMTNALFFLSYTGFAISLYPYIVPREITIWEAASPDSSLAFLLVGAVILIPIILIYTAHAYWVFRGKITEDVGYHH